MINIQRGTITAGLTKKQRMDRLWQMQHGKCCYCEQRIPDEGAARSLEHFRPQRWFPTLKEVWENVLLSCVQCTGNKGDAFPVFDGTGEVVKIEPSALGYPPAILDPANLSIDPEEHIGFDVEREEVFGSILARENSQLGYWTIKTIGLYKHFYTKRRADYLQFAILPQYAHLLRAHATGNIQELHASKATFRRMMSAKGEFAALVRAFARDKQLDQPPLGLHIPVGAEI